MHFESEFILNREHFAECYDQSLAFSKHTTPRFKLIAALVCAGGGLLLFAEQQNHLAFFLLALAGVEYLSFRYRRAWWLTRQVWSKNAGNRVKLLIDDQGIKTQSLYINSQLAWADIKRVEQTELGVMLTLHKGGANYLSAASLDPQAIAFIKQQVAN